MMTTVTMITKSNYDVSDNGDGDEDNDNGFDDDESDDDDDSNRKSIFHTMVVNPKRLQSEIKSKWR